MSSGSAWAAPADSASAEAASSAVVTAATAVRADRRADMVVVLLRGGGWCVVVGVVGCGSGWVGVGRAQRPAGRVGRPGIG
ncbi:hypothetical protein GCM10023340_37100 [Nocardioides marinquilinus]|uniref:Uncharacterized protein n=1 Tax=Nocardioides marinquilinus TaxID=1210400 RepID=A0ABP9PYR5_9ACTN